MPVVFFFFQSKKEENVYTMDPFPEKVPYCQESLNRIFFPTAFIVKLLLLLVLQSADTKGTA